MVLNVALDRIVPLTEVSARLSEIVEQTKDDQFWVSAKMSRYCRPEILPS